MSRLPVRLLALVLGVAAVLAIAGCGGSSGAAAQSAPAAPGMSIPAGVGAVQKPSAAQAVAMLAARTVIDVRTPAEFAAGHVAGAQNIDVEAADFGTKIAALDKTAPYLVYCRSGRRSAIAASQMAAAGFTDVVDGGGMADLVSAGAKTQP